MTKYYKGSLFLVSELNNEYSDTMYYAHNHIIDYKSSSFYKNVFMKLFYDLQKILEESIRDTSEEQVINDKRLIKELDKIIDKKQTVYGKLSIIYEIVTDQNNNLYGKELYTGMLFPLSKPYYSREVSCKLFSSSDIVWVSEYNTIFYRYDDVHFKNNSGSYFYLKMRFDDDAVLIGPMQYLEYERFRIDKYPLLKYDFNVKAKYNFPNALKCECLIYEKGIADINEVNAYQNMFKRGLTRKRKQQTFERMIIEYANKNVYKEEIVLKKEEQIIREKQTTLTSMMENIEFLLIKLSKVNNEAYLKYQKEYDDLINGTNDELNIKPLQVATLAPLEANIEFSLYFNKKDASSILEYLIKTKEEYLKNFLSGNEIKTTLTLDELEKINELFLKAKAEYSPVDQRNILKNLSFLYLMELKENISDIQEEKLKDSYLQDNLKSILICIESLRRVGLIKESILIDLNSEINLSNILEIISKIEFNTSLINNDNVKELVKKL